MIEGDAFETLRCGALEGRASASTTTTTATSTSSSSTACASSSRTSLDRALVIVDDTDWERVERAVDDYLAEQPRATELDPHRRQGPRPPGVVGGHARPALV